MLSTALLPLCTPKPSKLDFPGGSVVKDLPASAGDTGDMGLIPGSGGSPGGGNCNPLQHSCLRNPTDRGTCGATVHGVAKESDTTERLNNNMADHHPMVVGGFNISGR